MPVDDEAAAFGSAATEMTLVCGVAFDVVSFNFFITFFPFDFGPSSIFGRGAFGSEATSFFSTAAFGTIGS